MLFIKYFNVIIFFIFFLVSQTSNSLTSVAEGTCGKYIFLIEVSNKHDLYERKFKLYYKDKNGIKKLFYKAETGDGIDGACIKNKENEDFFLFREYCSGNACPENIFGIFDPKTKKILINPDDWSENNESEIEKIMGVNSSFFLKNKNFFCCDKLLYGYPN